MKKKLTNEEIRLELLNYNLTEILNAIGFINETNMKNVSTYRSMKKNQVIILLNFNSKEYNYGLNVNGPKPDIDAKTVLLFPKPHIPNSDKYYFPKRD